MKIRTVADVRREKNLWNDRLFAKHDKAAGAARYEVLDKNGGAVINPTTKARAEAYVAELDALCPSFAPHSIRAA